MTIVTIVTILTEVLLASLITLVVVNQNIDPIGQPALPSNFAGGVQGRNIQNNKLCHEK